MTLTTYGAILNRDDPPIPHASIGRSSPSTKTLWAIANNTDRDGWGDGLAWIEELTRNVNSNPPPSPADPLNHGIRIKTTVESGVTKPCREWALTSLIEDYSGQCDAVAVTGQVTRTKNTNAMWAFQGVVRDFISEAAAKTATRKVRAAELGISAVGNDTPRMREILLVTAGRTDEPYSGTAFQHSVGTGVHITASEADIYTGLYFSTLGAAQIQTAISIDTNSDYGVLIPTAAKIKRACFQTSASAEHGFLAYGNYSTAAFRMSENQWFVLGEDGSSAIRMRFNSGTHKIEFYRGATRIGYIDANGGDHAL